MMLNLIRHDRIWRGVAAWMPASLFAATAILGIAAYGASSSGGAEIAVRAWPGAATVPLSAFLFFCGTWATLALFLIFKASGGHYGRLSLTLPIPARQLWLTQLMATIAAGTLIIATIQLVGGLGMSLILSEMEDPFGRMQALANEASLLFLGLGFGALLLQSHRLRQDRIRSYRGWAAGTIALVTVPLLGLVFLPPLLVNLLWFALIGWGVSRWRAVPVSFTLVPDGARDGGRLGAAAAAGSWSPAGSTDGLGHLLFRMRVVYRHIGKNAALFYLALPMLVLFGITFTDAIGIWKQDSGLRFGFLVLTGYTLVAFTVGHLHRLALIDTLPISRRHLFAMISLPGLLAVLLGYGAGNLSSDRWPGSAELLHYALETEDGRGSQRAPATALDISWRGIVQSMEAPWGESHPAWSLPLLRGFAPIVQSSYTTPAGCSAEYFAWQMSRAIEAVYGTHIPADELRERYLSTNAQGSVVFRDGPPELRRDYPALRPIEHGPYFPVVLFLVAILWLLPTALSLRMLRVRRGERRRKLAVFSALGGLMFIHIAQYLPLMFGYAEDFGVFALWNQVVRGLERSVPGGTASLWLLGWAATLGLYLIAERQFLRHEMQAGCGGSGCSL